MAINFLDIENRNIILFSIADSDNLYYNDLIESFNKKYNNLFDIYNDFRFYKNHINELIELIEIERKKENFNLEKFYNFLLNIQQNNKTLLIIGN
ncbi:hypothetical protein [Chryseobacterium sp. ERMR1:04]|uniref:hypothetical protein n=1 Tax=Chryseobacterium sp. ERMR1:04 TaxID=1705393 RepID=UPI0006C8E535|nr:hypothetical protein [Chryseobacterium sp. ERMR1:04]KPH14068.1 hypothetical protein AMQ68_00640 [Chryseobacterium sp. ERMR1:04]